MFRWICVIAFMLVSSQSYAYRVEPMVAEMEPIGKRAQMSMRVDNTSTEPLTVELYPLAMTMDEYGTETLTEADSDLLVIPVTAIIEPGRSQSIMVRYLGDPSITQSKSYRIAVKQVKVNNSNSQTGQLGLLLQFETLVNVRPKNTNANIEIKGIEKKNNKWLIGVENKGDSYGRLSDNDWKITDGKNSKYLKGIEIGNLFTGTLVLPNSIRYFEMPNLGDFNLSNLKIAIEKD